MKIRYIKKLQFRQQTNCFFLLNLNTPTTLFIYISLKIIEWKFAFKYLKGESTKKWIWLPLTSIVRIWSNFQFFKSGIIAVFKYARCYKSDKKIFYCKQFACMQMAITPDLRIQIKRSYNGRRGRLRFKR